VSAADAATLAQLPQWAFAFVLVLARGGAACMLIPAIGEAEFPQIMRAGFALALTAVLLPVLAPDLPAAPASVLQSAAMIGAELATGLFLGWLARLLLLSLPIAGELIGNATGLTSVLQPDSVLGQHGSVTGRMFELAAPVVILASGLYALPLQALAGSYKLVPAGTLLPVADSTETAVAAVSACFSLALQLAGPFLLAAIVFHVALAALGRVAPQIQVFFLSAPAQLLGGMVLIGALSATLLAVWQDRMSVGLSLLPGH
jgi:flagellar biosynthetic protein FliR